MKSDTPFPGVVCLLGLAVIILLILFCAGCAEMQLRATIMTEHGWVSYSAKGIEIQVTK